MIKKCMLLKPGLICPEEKQAFSTISLSTNTIEDKVVDVASDLNSQLKKLKLVRVQISYIAQPANFIRGDDKDINIKEDFVEFNSTIDTTATGDVYRCWRKALTEFVLIGSN
ncbi:hypothetical protein RF11_13048 [Thelohanellus kitauei]|uniref:Uncharacterized protein n=1 Tax=Thelohanellus kitauei TaxID=669202 RepID=A0A0C2MYK3_THEKT|nr:hypothetical protein RF11_13048 [Thelohanellus kitauei]